MQTGNRRQVDGTSHLRSCSDDARAAVGEIGRKGGDRWARGIVRNENQHRKSCTDNRDGPMEKLGSADRLCLDSASFLQLEGGLLGDGERRAAPDDIHVA